MEQVVTVVFKVESEAYQAFSQLKRDMTNHSYIITQMMLVKKENGLIIPCETSDSGITTTDDTLKGGLIGMLAGVLGGPLGMLFGSSTGALIGFIKDAGDAEKIVSMAEQVSRALKEGDTALIALVREENPELLDGRFQSFETTILRQDAAVVAQEIEEAKELQKEIEKAADLKAREMKKADRKQKIEEKRVQIQAEFEKIGQKMMEL